MDGLTLVTGGAGFIGSHVVDALLTSGSDVRVLDDFSTGKDENLDGAWSAGGPGRRRPAGDRGRRARRGADARRGRRLRGRRATSRPCRPCAQSVEDPVGCDSVTHGGTVNAVRQAVEAGAERFVLASSCAVYGDAAQLPVAETTPPRPLSPYAGAKLASEEVCADAADAGQLTAVCLRFFNVYGPRQDPGSAYSGVISRFLVGRGRRRAGDHLRRRPPVARLRVRRRRGGGHPGGAAAAAHRRLGAQRRHRAADRPAGDPRRRRGAGRADASSGAWSRRARATSVTRAPTPAAPAGCSAGRPGPRSPPASPRRGRGSPARSRGRRGRGGPPPGTRG